MLDDPPQRKGKQRLGPHQNLTKVRLQERQMFGRERHLWLSRGGAARLPPRLLSDGSEGRNR